MGEGVRGMEVFAGGFSGRKETVVGGVGVVGKGETEEGAGRMGRSGRNGGGGAKETFSFGHRWDKQK